MEKKQLKAITAIKGRRGLWLQISKPNISGIAGFQNIDTEEKISDQIKKTSFLGNMVFITLAGHNNLDIVDVFENMSNLKEKVETIGDIIDLMPLAVPNYDETQFKPYQMVKLVTWFNILTNE